MIAHVCLFEGPPEQDSYGSVITAWAAEAVVERSLELEPVTGLEPLVLIPPGGAIRALDGVDDLVETRLGARGFLTQRDSELAYAKRRFCGDSRHPTKRVAARPVVLELLQLPLREVEQLTHGVSVGLYGRLDKRFDLQRPRESGGR
jgi:hypothetical protein